VSNSVVTRRSGPASGLIALASPLISRLRRLASGQTLPLAAVILVIAVVSQIDNSTFLSGGNVIALLRSAVTTFIIAAGATVLLTAGGLDLSVGGVFNLAAIVGAELMIHGMFWPLAFAVGLLSGVAVGLLNAGLVIYLRVPPIISTLSTFYAVSGLAVIITGGNVLAPLPNGFNAIGQNDLGPIPLLIVYAAVIGVAAHVLLSKSRFGYDVQAVGGNERAARANGISIQRIKLWVYALSGAAAALAGLLYAARTGAGDPQAGGTDITFQVIAAVLIGGTSLFGGVGRVLGTALGAILFAEIDNSLVIIGINPLYQDVIVGVILAVAVALDSWRRRRVFEIARGGA
jgi:ribose transport system permease protein